MGIIVDAARRERASLWASLIVEIVPMFRDGGTLRNQEALWLSEWLATQGRGDLEIDDVQCVQVPRDWAATVLGGHHENASRALRALQEVGILSLVHKGIKGHASLYCVNPLPELKGDTLTYHEGNCEVKYPHTLEKYPHTLGEIPSHQDSVTWGDTT